jgi:hypothetical protein
MASDQSNAAAERSAHVLRDEPRPGGALIPMVEVEPGVWRLRIIVELEARLAAAEAERDAARADVATAFARGAEAMRREAEARIRAGAASFEKWGYEANTAREWAAVISDLPLPEMEARRDD